MFVHEVHNGKTKLPLKLYTIREKNLRPQVSRRRKIYNEGKYTTAGNKYATAKKILQL